MKTFSVQQDSNKISSNDIGPKVMLWLAVVSDVLFFGLLYTYAEIYEYPRGYYLFFTEGDPSLSYFAIPIYAALSAYYSYVSGKNYKLLSGTMFVFNVILSFVSVSIFIYFW